MIYPSDAVLFAMYRFQPGMKSGGLKGLRHVGEHKGSIWSRIWNRGQTAGQNARVWQSECLNPIVCATVGIAVAFNIKTRKKRRAVSQSVAE